MNQYFAICAPGLESVAARELAGLGLPGRIEAGGVGFAGGAAEAYRANLRGGTILRVLQRVTSFRARRFPSFIEAVAAVPWERWIGETRTISIKASARRSRLYHTGALIERAAAAIAGRLERPVEALLDDAGGAPVAIQLRVESDAFTVSIDLSGELLSKRGGHENIGKAPLRADLARALIHLSGWQGEGAVIDPFVGSGTLLREAHSVATGTAPGRHRAFAFQSFPDFDARAWNKELADADAAVLAVPQLRLHGSDRDAGAIVAAAENLARAGIHAELRCATVSSSVLGEAAVDPVGLIATNPPFGRRVRGGDLRPLYQTLGELVKGARARPGGEGLAIGLVAADLGLVRATGLPLVSRAMTDHGGLKVFLCTERAPA